MDHDTELHECSVDLPTASVDDVHIVLADRFSDAHTCLTNAAFRHLCFGQREPNTANDLNGRPRNKDMKKFTGELLSLPVEDD